MEKEKYFVIVNENVVAKCELDAALILIEGLFNKYYLDENMVITILKEGENSGLQF